MNDPTTADVRAAQRGDLTAFGRLYDRHAAVVLSICRRLSVNDAEDAAQETFLRAHRLLANLRNDQRFTPWLYGIARRVCSERRRATRRRRTHEDIAMTQAAVIEHHRAMDETVVDHAARRESLDRLTEALDQLDDRERLAVHLYYLDADPIASARDALGLSRSAYYKLLNRARNRLAALMRQVQPS